ncbi:MAG: hypothetical protein WDZ49_09555 [Litorilinea sp.]
MRTILRIVAVWLDWLARPRTTWLDGLFYCVLATLFYFPLALGWASFEAGDFADHFLPFTQFLQRELSVGRIPLWNPYTYSGHPFLADIQAGVYYLPAYPFLLMGGATGTDAGQLYWLQWEAIAHTALAGWGMHRLLLALTGVRRAAAFAGVAFMLSGFVTGYAPLQLAVLRSAVWLPFALAALWVALHQPRRLIPWLMCGVWCALIVLGGHGQIALYASYTLVAWAGLCLWQIQRGGGYSRRGWIAVGLGLAATLAIALGLAAGQLLPGWEFLQRSVRADLDYATVSGGLPLRDTWQVLLPGVFSQFSPLYMGAVGLVIALVAAGGALWGRRGDYAVVRLHQHDAMAGPNSEGGVASGRPAARFFIVLAVLGLLASYGANAQFYPLLHWGAPGWDLFRGQERAAYLVALSLAALTGLGLAWVPTAGRTLRKRSALLLGGAVTVVVYGFGVLYQLLGSTAVGDYAYLWIAFYSLLFGLASALCLWFDGWSRARSALLVGILVANLGAANFGVNWEWVNPGARVAWDPVWSALAELRPTEGRPDPGRVFNEFRVVENYGMRLGLEDVWGASPLRLAAYAQWFDAFPLDRMWQLTGVEYVLTWRHTLFGPSELLAEFPQATDTTYLHRLPAPMPRAWAVTAVEPLPDDAVLARLADHQVDLTAWAAIAPETATSASAWSRAAVESVARTPGQHALRVDAPGAAFVVISENWMPGWEVTAVDCGDAPVCPTPGTVEPKSSLPYLTPLRTNLSLIGLVVPPGVTYFELHYRPRAVRVGALITATTLVLILAAAGVEVWRSRTAR